VPPVPGGLRIVPLGGGPDPYPVGSARQDLRRRQAVDAAARREGGFQTCLLHDVTRDAEGGQDMNDCRVLQTLA